MSTESTRSDKFQQVADAKDLSQLVRSNTVHYWTTMKNSIDLRGLKPYLDCEGMLAGDPHAGNFAVLPLRAIDGSRGRERRTRDDDGRSARSPPPPTPAVPPAAPLPGVPPVPVELAPAEPEPPPPARTAPERHARSREA